MRRDVWMRYAVLLVAAAGMTTMAHATEISINGNSPTQVEGRCGNKPGGVYFPPTSLGVYGCMNLDGSGIVCGGTGRDAKTCGTWPPGVRVLPTRTGVRAAVKQQQVMAK